MADKTDKRAGAVADAPDVDPAAPAEDAADDADADEAEDGDDVGDGEVAEAFEDPGDELAPLPEPVTIVVDLPPPPPREVPEDEAALTIDEVAVNPGLIQSVQEPITMSVAIPGHTPGGHHNHSGSGTGVAAGLGAPVRAAEVFADPAFTQSRRDRLRGDAPEQPEPAAMLTADRLLEVNRKTRPAPRTGWHRFVYQATLHLVNLGESAKERAHRELDQRIRKAFDGGTRFVPVLTRKGGVGKTTITALLGMALADAREDRIIAIDANPDRGTLAERISKQNRATVRDVVHKARSISGFTDFSALVARDETRLDILASDTDPMLSEAFDENDYNVVADLTARYYSIVLTDCGTGIVHSVMRATLQRADSLVVVSGGSVDESRLASETLTWLEANGYGELVRNSVVALNTATQGTNMVKLDEIEAHFRSRVREIIRIPYDPQLAAGAAITYRDLKPLTRQAARDLAAMVVDGLPAEREA